SDGRPFWNRISLAPVRDDRGAVTHYIGVLNDVTARREAEEALRSREARFRSMLEYAHDIVAVLDGDGSVTFASPAVERVLGYSRETLEGMELLHLVHPDDLRAVQLALDDAVMRPGMPVWVELRLKHRDGGWRIMETVGTSLLHMPSVMGVVVNARDVSDRRAAEAALAESRMQFLQAQKMEAVGRLAGGVAHDFNNLLTAIRGNADLLLLSLEEGDPAREDVMEIRRASDRAAELTRQLLAFSRRQVMQPRVLNLNEVVNGVERMLRRLITGDVQLHARLDPALGDILADAGQLEQVLVNLAVNARDAMPGGGQVEVETENVELDADTARRLPYVVPGPYVLLRVRDTGHGMDADTRERVFEPFFTTKEPGKGTGLGLSTVYGIVKQSGGYIWVDSEPGAGTTFSIYLPRTGDPAGVEAAAVPEAHAPPPAAGETVLVVDDEVAVRNLAGRILARAGYRVLEVDDGFEALRIAGEGAPLHLLVTDLSMPRMGGRELARRLLALRPEVRVLFFSGTATEMEEAPGAAFLEKPFASQALLATVRDVLAAPPGPGQQPLE
ncbi:MAG TPA: PAS domain S-box protein, partial [Longimicrobiaceae bacterium]|nr:PAS domain S-box protein [Longimicrobiaceae bacterium]